MALIKLLLLSLLVNARGAPAPEPRIMNQGGMPYRISNPPGSTPGWVGTPGEYSTNFNTNVAGAVEHFDVYGEVRTQYSQVYWTRNTPINLPPQLVERFKGKVMAITGYEVDQVTHTGPQPGSTTTPGGALGGFSCYPDCSAGDASVPIYHAYNHHYFGWLTGADAELYDREQPAHLPNPTRTGVRTKANASQTKFPTNIVFKENPGGEFRKSYHGYPSGFAQLLHSPTQWVVEPMQIDTHNRNYSLTDTPGYKPDLLPKQSQNRMTQRNQLSPLIECPCSDRIRKFSTTSSSILTAGACSLPIATLSQCTAAVSKLAPVASSVQLSNTSLPHGCILAPGSPAGSYAVLFNTAPSSASCGSGAAKTALSGASLGSLVNLSMSHDGHTARVTMAGPAGAWFGVGFDAESMADAPYALIIDGGGAVSERRLAEHGPGAALAPSVAVVSSSVAGGIREVVLTRAVAGASSDYFSFPSTPGDMNLITAVGDTPQLAYHKARTGATLTLLPTASEACVCAPVEQEYMSYMNASTTRWSNYDCLDEPRSDMLRHGDGTGRALSNQACAMGSYHGGLKCCQHKFFLTDKAQAPLIKNQTDVYFLKWRYYFQEYSAATATAKPSHRHLHHWVFLIDASVNDYEEDSAEYGQASVGLISAHLTGKDIGLEDLPANYSTITPLVMTPHCHAPSCIREELWNADTNQIICNVTAEYGQAKFGDLKAVFNEEDYVAIPPCIFGSQPGLQQPFTLTASTNITAHKYFNNTYRHLGQMAQWTGLMVYDTDPF